LIKGLLGFDPVIDMGKGKARKVEIERTILADLRNIAGFTEKRERSSRIT